MPTLCEVTAASLISYIKCHGNRAWLREDGRIGVESDVRCLPCGGGACGNEVAVAEDIEATWDSVRAYLGYKNEF